jgi:hypothetical protein
LAFPSSFGLWPLFIDPPAWMRPSGTLVLNSPCLLIGYTLWSTTISSTFKSIGSRRSFSETGYKHTVIFQWKSHIDFLTSEIWHSWFQTPQNFQKDDRGVQRRLHISRWCTVIVP